MPLPSSAPSVVLATPGTRRAGRLSLLRFPLLVAAGLVAAEVGMRLPAVAPWLPEPTIYYDTAVPKRLDALDALLRARGRVDVLFIGSSVVRTNISPLEFDPLVARRSGFDVVSFNGGLSGLWPAGVDLYLRDLWIGRARPRVVVQSIRYSELRATDFSVDRRLLDGTAEGHWYHGSTLDRLEWWATDHIRLLQFRGAMGRWMRDFADGWRGEDDSAARWEIDSRGFTARGPSLDVLLARGLLRNEKPYEGGVPAGACRFGFAALQRSCDATRTAGAAYVLLNMPEHAFRWSGPDGRADYASYLAAVEDFARQNGIEFVDLTDGDPERFHDNREFADFHHMTPAGARHVTSLLAERLAGSRVLADSVVPRVATRSANAGIGRPGNGPREGKALLRPQYGAAAR